MQDINLYKETALSVIAEGCFRGKLLVCSDSHKDIVKRDNQMREKQRG